MSSSLADPDRANSHSHAGSRLAQCPLCSKFTHVALIEAHAAQCSGEATSGVERSDALDGRLHARAPDATDAPASDASPSGALSMPAKTSSGVLGALAAARRRHQTSPSRLSAHKRRRRTSATLSDVTNVPLATRCDEDVRSRAVNASTQTDAVAEKEEEETMDVDAAVADVEGGAPSSVSFDLRVMSGNHEECGICLTRFDDVQGVVRHMFYPCQHVRQCGECAQRVWQVPKVKRRCPWCKSKIEIRPRAFKPFL
jgi:hypothetical protein